MEFVTVGPKYQIVIPKSIRKRMKGVKPGDKVALGAVDQNTATIRTEPLSWVERNRGLMKEAWKGIDTTKYLEKLRNEWERKY